MSNQKDQLNLYKVMIKEAETLRAEVERLNHVVKLHEIMDNIPHGDLGKKYKRLREALQYLVFQVEKSPHDSGICVKKAKQVLNEE